MCSIVCIVEGHGDVAAVPIVVRRIAGSIGEGFVPDVAKPIRIGRQRLLRPTELERAVELAARQCGPAGAILIVLDADDDCPGELGPKLLERARACRPDRLIHVVLARREFESWFVAAARSIRGRRGLVDSLEPDPQPEELHDAKGWLSNRMPLGRYRETVDQPAFAAVFDIALARSARSFDKLWRSVASILRDYGCQDAVAAP